MISLFLSFLLFYIVSYSLEWGAYLLFKASYSLENDALLDLSGLLESLLLHKPLLFSLCLGCVFGFVYLRRKRHDLRH